MVERLFEVGAYSGWALIRGGPLFEAGPYLWLSTYSRWALIRGGPLFVVERLFEVGAYSRWALVRGGPLFEAGPYSWLSAYSNKHDNYFFLFRFIYTLYSKKERDRLKARISIFITSHRRPLSSNPCTCS